VVAHPLDERGDAGALGPGQALDTGTVGPNGDDRRAERVVGRRVQQRLQVGPRTRDEDDKPDGQSGTPS